MRDYLSYGIAVFVVCERFTFCILCGRNAFHCAQLFLCSLLLLCSTCKSTVTKGYHIFYLCEEENNTFSYVQISSGSFDI